MEKIKLLIVDDVEDNRLVLRAICRKMDGFEIYEAVDGRDAVEQCDVLLPNIVLMDVMMPRLDGFQAAKLIKEKHPQIVVMAVTAVVDPKMEENMASIGVAAYIRKPIDKELLRLKLQSYAGALSTGGHQRAMMTKTVALNPFSDDIRSFKTHFDIHGVEAIMDLGVWLLVRFECAHAAVCTNVDMVIEMLYAFLHEEVKSGTSVNITIEESFDEMFIHVPLIKHVQTNRTIEHLLQSLGTSCVINGNMVAFRLVLAGHAKIVADTVKGSEPQADTRTESAPHYVKSIEALGEKRSIGMVENQVLRESFEIKTTAVEYVASIDADAFGEIRDLQETQEQWLQWMDTLRGSPREEDFVTFADEILSSYATTISALYEFSGLSYTMVSLSTLIKANASVLAYDEEKRLNTVTFLEGFKNDISTWIEHVFFLQDAQDIHYLDGSFFSSCMIIESIITGVEVDLGDEGEIEFF